MRLDHRVIGVKVRLGGCVYHYLRYFPLIRIGFPKLSVLLLQLPYFLILNRLLKLALGQLLLPLSLLVHHDREEHNDCTEDSYESQVAVVKSKYIQV